MTTCDSLTVVEASAGTGKTHRITELVVEHVVGRGVPIEQILVVTFTRAATAELRDRIRRRLVQAAADQQLPPDELARARRAVVSFDLAPVTTIHGFCHQALAWFGGTGAQRGDALVTDDGELRDEVINDAVLAEIAAMSTASPLAALFLDGDKPVLTEAKVREVVRLLLVHPTATVHVDGPAHDPTASAWRDLLTRIRTRIIERRAELGVLTHDDVVRLTLDAARSDPAARRALAARYRLVLVDEFQDTDPLQWAVFAELFLAAATDADRAAPDAPAEVVVVGDPKQAIYAFRGADVHAYLAARELAARTDTLGESWRMEPTLITAMNTLLRDATFGEAQIAHADLRRPRRRDAGPSMRRDQLAPLTVRVIPNDAGASRGSAPTYVSAERGRAAVATDVASMAADLLARHVELTPAGGTPRPLRPSDVAVLVTNHREASLVAAALRDVGLRCVQRGTANVAGRDSDAARHWRWLLDALQRPAAPAAASLAALSWFIGWTPERVAAADDDELMAVQEQLVDWRRRLAQGGVPALVAAVRADTALSRRLLARSDGERAITDLDHLAELLHTAVPRGCSPDELLDALDDLAEHTDDLDERVTRRIDSDDDAVQVLTIHASKGLQFPVTLVPYLWPGGPSAPPTFHDGHQLVVDVTYGSRDAGLKQRSTAEQQGVDARLMYVALTRAQHRCVVWWGLAYQVVRPLTQVLLGRTPDGSAVDPTAVPNTKGDAPRQCLARLVEAAGGTIRVSDLGATPQQTTLAIAADVELGVRRFTRALPRGRMRHSFSSIAAGAHSAPAADAAPADDEPTEPSTVPATITAAAPLATGAVETALADLAAAGTEFGNAMHTLFEVVDFAAPDLPAEVDAALARCWPRHAVPVDLAAVARGVVAVLASPTGPRLGHRPLHALRRADRLDELGFELPLATAGGAARPGDLAALIADHTDPASPLAGYARRLAEQARTDAPAGGDLGIDLVGHLTGSIDLLARVPHDDGHRYVVCDYKTNQLAGSLPAGPTRLTPYHPDALWPEMERHHYPLQAVLYTVAVHRYLRWRLAGYAPARHLGGAAYLFVRGMAGPDTPVVDGRPFGICSFDIPASLTVALSDLLDGRHP